MDLLLSLQPTSMIYSGSLSYGSPVNTVTLFTTATLISLLVQMNGPNLIPLIWSPSYHLAVLSHVIN